MGRGYTISNRTLFKKAVPPQGCRVLYSKKVGSNIEVYKCITVSSCWYGGEVGGMCRLECQWEPGKSRLFFICYPCRQQWDQPGRQLGNRTPWSVSWRAGHSAAARRSWRRMTFKKIVIWCTTYKWQDIQLRNLKEELFLLGAHLEFLSTQFWQMRKGRLVFCLGV